MSELELFEVYFEEGPTNRSVLASEDEETLRSDIRETIPDKFDIVIDEVISYGEYQGRQHYEDVLCQCGEF